METINTSDAVKEYEMAHNDKRMLKHLVLEDYMAFVQYFFKERDALVFKISPHHKVIVETLMRVINGEITRLIINVPPGYTKTELAVIFFVAYGLAINPKAKYIHATYSDELALENSSKAKDIIESEQFQELFNIEIRKDSSAKKKWYTTEGGGILAAAAGGAITGFRAGRFEEGFQGAFIFDDPIKPDDAFSETMRNKINTRFMNTFKSRLAVESVTPMIVIMQRIHDDDPCGFLLRGGTGEMWHHLLLPSPVPPGPVKMWYPKEYTHGIPIEYDIEEGALWPFKHTDEQLENMDKADPYTTASQYHQSPSPKGGSIFKDQWWKLWTILPRDLQFIRIYGDTAQQTADHNDYTVLQAWAYSPSMGIFLLDQFRDKLEAPQLEQTLKDFWNKTLLKAKELSIPLTHLKLENKSSGSSLIQNIQQKTHIPVFPIEREKDKVTRSFNFVPHIASGHVWIPQDAPWVFDYKDEFRKFTPQKSGSHDDQIDPTLDAIEDMLSNKAIEYAGVEAVEMGEEYSGSETIKTMY